MQESIKLPVSQLRSFMTEVFVACGVPQQDANICSDVLMTADLCGIDSHGINRLKMYVDRIQQGTQLAVSNWEKIVDNKVATVIDAANGMGQIASYHAMKIAIEKARDYGCGITTVKNGNHFGIAGYYARMAIAENMIGIVFTNARPCVAATFGVEPILGTNPVCCGIPSDLPFPFLLDMATSIIQRGKVEVLAKINQDTPEGLAIKNDGNFATDSKQILQDLLVKSCALLPLGGAGESTGGHKGYGLSLMVEMLSSVLSQANYLRNTSGVKDGKKIPLGLGHFFMAINVAHFLPIESCKQIVGNIMHDMQASTKVPGHEKIYLAGEKEFLQKKIREQEGIPINQTLQNIMLDLKKQFHLDGFSFPFE